MRLGLSLVATCALAPLLLASCETPETRSFSTATACTVDLVHEIVPQFIDAFNRGDRTQLDALFADSNFAWYSTDAPGQRFNAAAKDRSTLIAYFAARHRAHEHLDLTSLNVTFVSELRGGFTFLLTRRADDLQPTRYNGKGEIQCRVMPASIAVWAMDPHPWSPIELLPWAAALTAGIIAIIAIVLWRRRKLLR
jgi:hypothetical protein